MPSNPDLAARAVAAVAELSRLDANDTTYQGPDVGVEWGSRPGFACKCRWAGAYHGNVCPEHGKTGVPLLSEDGKTRLEYADLLAALAERVKELEAGMDRVLQKHRHDLDCTCQIRGAGCNCWRKEINVLLGESA